MRLPPKDACCWSCRHFSRKERPELAGQGRGQCNGWYVPGLADWNDRACGLYREDRANAEARRVWVAGLAR